MNIDTTDVKVTYGIYVLDPPKEAEENTHILSLEFVEFLFNECGASSIDDYGLNAKPQGSIYVEFETSNELGWPDIEKLAEAKKKEILQFSERIISHENNHHNKHRQCCV